MSQTEVFIWSEPQQSPSLEIVIFNNDNKWGPGGGDYDFLKLKDIQKVGIEERTFLTSIRKHLLKAKRTPI